MGHAICNRDRRARGRAAGHVADAAIPHALRRAVMRIDADAGIGEFGHVGAADDDEAGPAQPRHNRRVSLSRCRILQRARARAGHLPLDVVEILDRDGNAGIGRRRGACLAQMIHRICRGERRIIDMNESPCAFAGGIGNPCEAFLDQFARGGAPGVEVGRQAGECRMVRHGVLDYFLCDLPWRGLSPMTGWHTSALARRECGHATAPLLGPLTEIGQCRIKTATSG